METPMQQCDSCDATAEKTFHVYHHTKKRWMDIPSCEDCATLHEYERWLVAEVCFCGVSHD
jgi:hypothetical protein